MTVEKKKRGFQKGDPRITGRPKGSPNKDPDAVADSLAFRARIIFNINETRRMQWVMKHFACTASEAIRMSVNMMCEMAQHYEKGYELYFERTLLKKRYRRRIIIS